MATCQAVATGVKVSLLSMREWECRDKVHDVVYWINEGRVGEPLPRLCRPSKIVPFVPLALPKFGNVDCVRVRATSVDCG
jgi:hypothetical protein